MVFDLAVELLEALLNRRLRRAGGAGGRGQLFAQILPFPFQPPDPEFVRLLGDSPQLELVAHQVVGQGLHLLSHQFMDKAVLRQCLGLI